MYTLSSMIDLYLNQTLPAIRFHVNESTKYSPFFLLYNRDVVLPLDTILKPRRRYMGEDQNQVALQQQHKSFVQVHRNLKEAKRKQKIQADKGSKEEIFHVGDRSSYPNSIVFISFNLCI